MKKQLITLLLIGFTAILFSQNQNKSINVNSNFVGMHCPGGSGPCGIIRVLNKSQSNTQMSFDSKSNELILVISKKKLDNTSKLKLTNNELEKGFYLYKFDEDFVLSQDILIALDIKNRSKIKQGNYLVKIKEDNIIMTLKLE